MKYLFNAFCLFYCFCCLNAQETGIITEKSPSRSEYFSWINNTNEGANEEQTLVNLDFFTWLHSEYGMKLDIYAFDAGAIDGKNFYGTMQSERFKKNFPYSFKNINYKAKQIGTRLGIWGGPDGFGNTPKEAEKRINQMSSLCKDYNWALFKFDCVCGPLRPEKEEEFIDMMIKCRKYSPDLILLNHRLGLNKGKPYATTFLWEGQETYIDVHMGNHFTAPYNRACVLERGLVPNLDRLTEDHGVCLSSCLDYWEDDLVLQAFNRSLILAPEIYGNPWLLSDNEYPKLARLFNLHKKLSDILVDGMELPATYGKYAVSRGNDRNRILTLRNINWYDSKIEINLNSEIGLKKGKKVYVRQYHPSEHLIGEFKYGDKISITVPSFRSMLLLISTDNKYKEPAIEGTDFEIIKDIANRPLEINALGYPGESFNIKLKNIDKIKKVFIDGKENQNIKSGKQVTIKFEGEPYSQHCLNKKICDLVKSDETINSDAFYEATVFSADNNAFEVRSLERSGDTDIPEVKKARDMFFNQSTFIERGLWDKYLFDGKMSTGFWPSKRFIIDQRIKDGCFRLDLGEKIMVDSIVIRTSNYFELEPLFKEEGTFAYISSDLSKWEKIVYLANLNSVIPVNKEIRYLKLPAFPSCIKEVEVYSKGKKLNSSKFRASNLFADSKKMQCEGLWKSSFTLDEIPYKSYLSVAINGKHGIEGAYAVLKVDDKLIGASSRAVSYPSNTWEYVNVNKNIDSNYTYYIPIDNTMKGKKMEVFVMGYDKDNLNFKPEVWLTLSPNNRPSKRISIEKQ